MTEPEIQFSQRLSRRNPVRIAAILAGCLALVVGAAVTMGASPSASPSVAASTADPSATATPDASGDPDKPNRGPWNGDLRGAFDGRGRFGGAGIGAITITSISGSNLSLETDDGWTRTIAITSTTTITKGGQAIAAADLSVGDAIRFSQTRAADGSFTIAAIKVVLPSVAGTVTATSATSITIERGDGSSVTINVDSDTTYSVAGVTDADLGDVAVGMRLVAAGNQNADGSLDATVVRAGNGRFHDGTRDHDKPGEPAPTASPESSSSTG